MATEEGCAELALAEQERRLLETIRAVERSTIAGDLLWLEAEDGQALLLVEACA